MGATVRSVWHGAALKQRALQAVVAAVSETTAAAAQVAAAHTPVDTGRLAGSMGAAPTEVRGTHVVGLFGTVNDAPDYALPVELGHHTASGSFVPGVHMVTQAADQTLPTVGARIAARMG